MNKVFYIALILLSTNLFGQSTYEDILYDLKSEFGYNKEWGELNKQEDRFNSIVATIERCSEVGGLANYQQLGFDDITTSKIEYLRTKNYMKEGPYHLVFCQWMFPENSVAENFESILNMEALSNFRNCVSKGGISWWRIDDVIYIIIGRGVIETDYYNKIVEIVENRILKNAR